MENKVFFSIAKYVPDLLRDEQINFGYSYFYPATKSIGFIASKNTSRILSFDDELDLESINLLRGSLEYDFSLDSFEMDDDEEYLTSLLNKDSNDILFHKTKNYINQIQFTAPNSLIVDDDLEKTLNDIGDIFLYYDRPKKERKMDKDRIRQLSKKILKSKLDKDSYFEYKKNSLSFTHKPYDFRIISDGEIKFIKALSFDYKKHYRLYEELKIFMYDLNISLESDSNINLDDFIVVINQTNFSTEAEKLAKTILEEKVKLLTIDQLVVDINKNSLLNYPTTN